MVVLILIVRKVAIDLASGGIVAVAFMLAKIMFVVVSCRIGCIASLGLRGLWSLERDGVGASSGLPRRKSHRIHVVVTGYALNILWMAFLQRNPDPSLKMG